TRRGIHRISERGVLDAVLAAEVADHRLAPVEPDSGLADRRQLGVDAAAERLAGLPDRIARARGAFAVVGPGDRRAPEGDHRVADVLVDQPAVVEHDLADRLTVEADQTGARDEPHDVASLG